MCTLECDRRMFEIAINKVFNQEKGNRIREIKISFGVSLSSFTLSLIKTSWGFHHNLT
jgi:hypothetical protein